MLKLIQFLCDYSAVGSQVKKKAQSLLYTWESNMMEIIGNSQILKLHLHLFWIIVRLQEILRLCIYKFPKTLSYFAHYTSKNYELSICLKILKYYFLIRMNCIFPRQILLNIIIWGKIWVGKVRNEIEGDMQNGLRSSSLWNEYFSTWMDVSPLD